MSFLNKVKNILPAKFAYCPYCYTENKPGEFVYRCSGQPKPNKKRCESEADMVLMSTYNITVSELPIVDPKNQASKDNNSSAKVICDSCGGPCYTRLFPCCHMPVPIDYTAKSPLIGLVGGVACGKTVLLNVLDMELRQQIGPRFEASVAMVSDDVDSLVQGSTLTHTRDELANPGGLLPQATMKGTREVPYIYEWRFMKKNKSTVFSFYDTAGENLLTTRDAREMRYLQATNALIWLIDPFSLPNNREKAAARGITQIANDPVDVLKNLTTILSEIEGHGKNAKIKRPIAVTLAKIDAFADEFPKGSPAISNTEDVPYFNDSESLVAHEEIGGMIHHWGGRALHDYLETHYQNFRYFSLSALGHQPDYASARVSELGLAPLRVTEPLLWTLARSGFIASK